MPSCARRAAVEMVRSQPSRETSGATRGAAAFQPDGRRAIVLVGGALASVEGVRFPEW